MSSALLAAARSHSGQSLQRDLTKVSLGTRSREVYASRYTRCEPFTASSPLQQRQGSSGDGLVGAATMHASLSGFPMGL